MNQPSLPSTVEVPASGRLDRGCATRRSRLERGGGDHTVRAHQPARRRRGRGHRGGRLAGPRGGHELARAACGSRASCPENARTYGGRPPPPRGIETICGSPWQTCRNNTRGRAPDGAGFNRTRSLTWRLSGSASPQCDAICVLHKRSCGRRPTLNELDRTNRGWDASHPPVNTRADRNRAWGRRSWRDELARLAGPALASRVALCGANRPPSGTPASQERGTGRSGGGCVELGMARPATATACSRAAQPRSGQLRALRALRRRLITVARLSRTPRFAGDFSGVSVTKTDATAGASSIG